MFKKEVSLKIFVYVILIISTFAYALGQLEMPDANDINCTKLTLGECTNHSECKLEYTNASWWQFLTASQVCVNKCKAPECTAPPEGCKYLGEKDENGCAVCGKLDCMGNSLDPTVTQLLDVITSLKDQIKDLQAQLDALLKSCAISTCPAGKTNVDTGQKTELDCPIYACKPSECLITECGTRVPNPRVCPDGINYPRIGCIRQIDGNCTWKVKIPCPSICGNGICEDGEEGGCPSVGDGPCWSGTCPQDCNKCSAEGQTCGGFNGAQCCSGFTCKLDGDYADASGVCVKSYTCPTVKCPCIPVTLKQGSLSANTVKPGELYAVMCDYGINSVYMRPEASGSTFDSYGTIIETKYIYNYRASFTPGKYPHYCLLGNGIMPNDLYCPQRNFIRNLTVSMAPPPPQGQIWGRVFFDDNGNKIWDGSEKYVRDVGNACNTANTIAGQLTITITGNGVSKTVSPSVCAGTGTDAFPYFDSGLVLNPGTYQVAVTPPAGWTLTTPKSYSLMVDTNTSPAIQWVAVKPDATLPPIPSKRVGILYATWDAPAATAMSSLAARGLPQYTMEDVMKSNGALTISDMLLKPEEIWKAAFFHYMVKPQLDYYCIYRVRTNEYGYYPDCPNIAQTLRTHADQLWSAGVDFVVTDATNLPKWAPPSPSISTDNELAQAEVLQLRPTEVLFEEWKKLRDQGVMTPEITVWARIPAGANLYKEYLSRIYNNPAYDNLVMKDAKTGKKVMLVVNTDADPNIINEIESNGGKNNIILVKTWALLSATDRAQGVWSFNDPCWYQGKLTASIIGRNCDQLVTANSSFGSQMGVTPTMQVSYASQPFNALGRLAGQTLKKQFAEAFKIHPDYLTIGNWNFFTSQPQAGIDDRGSMGMEYVPSSDYFKNTLWTDAFGAEFVNSIEPTVEYGDYYYDLLKSCLRVYRNGVSASAGEECLNLDSSDNYINVYSMETTASANPNSSEHMITTDVNEKNYLVTTLAWKEVCTPYGGTSIFCVDPTLTGYDGPFVLFKNGKSAANRVPLYRCIAPGQYHFISLSSGCEGQAMEAPMGLISTVKNSETPRSLHRCWSDAKHYFHWMGNACPAGSSDKGLMGFVK